MGIYIGSRTPPEIAISILAEVMVAKNGVSLPTPLQVVGARAAREAAAMRLLDMQGQRDLPTQCGS